MGREVPRVWKAADEVDPLTGLATFEHLRGSLGEALAGARATPAARSLMLTVVEVPAPVVGDDGFDRVELARRLTLAGDMARSAFGSALAVGRLGARRVGVLCDVDVDADLETRSELLARMVRDVPGTVRVVPLVGSREVVFWTLLDLSL